MTFLAGWVLGVLSLLGYVVWRMLRSDGWDRSNVTNALRVISHVAMHPGDLGKMYYSDGSMPFWYIGYDELSEVVKTRPEDKNG